MLIKIGIRFLSKCDVGRESTVVVLGALNSTVNVKAL